LTTTDNSIRTGGKDNTNALRFLAYGLATFCENTDDVAWSMVGNRNTLEENEFEDTLERVKENHISNPNIGFPTCKTIAAAGAAQCQSCPLFGKIVSPLSEPAADVQNPAPAQDNSPVVEPTEFVDPWDVGSAPPFPLDTLHPDLRACIQYRHDTLGSTISAIAMMSLSAIIAAVNQQSRVRMMQHTDWRSTIRMWALTIGDPSTLKSPTMDRVYGELININRDNCEAAALKQAAFKKAKEEAKATKDKSFDAEPPAQATRAIINEPTAEKVAEILSRDPRGSNVYRHEIAGFIAGLDRYHTGSGGSDQAFYLETFDGGPHTKDRVKGEIFVKNASLNIIGGIQPDKLAEMRDLQADGMLARFIPIPLEAAGDTQDIPAGDVTKNYDRMIREVYNLPVTGFAFDLAAQQVCDGVRADLKGWERVGAFGRGFTSWVGKLPTLYASLCVSLLLSDSIYDWLPSTTVAVAGGHRVGVKPENGPVVPNTITEGVAIRAERILREYVIPVGIFFYHQLLGGRAQETTLAMASFILTSDKDRFTPSDFTSSVRPMRHMGTWEVSRQASILVALGWLIEDGKGRTPSAWIVPRGLRTRMAERRAAEMERKAEIRERIAEMAACRRAERTPPKPNG